MYERCSFRSENETNISRIPSPSSRTTGIPIESRPTSPQRFVKSIETAIETSVVRRDIFQRLAKIRVCKLFGIGYRFGYPKWRSDRSFGPPNKRGRGRGNRVETVSIFPEAGPHGNIKVGSAKVEREPGIMSQKKFQGSVYNGSRRRAGRRKM